MKFEKKHLDDITRCYCASHMFVDDEPILFFASENPESPCIAYSGEDFSKREIVWEDRGGCMSIIPFEDRKGEFLAVNEFYLKVSPSHAKLVWGKKTDDGFVLKDVFNLPFLHRFDIFHVEGKDYVLCATIARDKADKEDWSRPGQIYVGEIPTDLENENVVLRELVDGQYHNHGYFHSTHEGKPCGYFASDEGVYRVDPPMNGADWKVTKLKDGKTSEIAFNDLDGDGVDEMMTIEPFHGNIMKIYKLVDGEYKEVYQYPNEIDFAHALKADTIGGKKCFVCGVRRVDAEIFVVTYENGEYAYTILEKEAGPANVDTLHYNGKDYILSANHTKNEAAIYEYVGE